MLQTFTLQFFFMYIRRRTPCYIQAKLSYYKPSLDNFFKCLYGDVQPVTSRLWSAGCLLRWSVAAGRALVTSRASASGSGGTPRAAARAVRTPAPLAQRTRNASDPSCSL